MPCCALPCLGGGELFGLDGSGLWTDVAGAPFMALVPEHGVYTPKWPWKMMMNHQIFGYPIFRQTHMMMNQFMEYIYIYIYVYIYICIVVLHFQTKQLGSAGLVVFSGNLNGIDHLGMVWDGFYKPFLRNMEMLYCWVCHIIVP